MKRNWYQVGKIDLGLGDLEVEEVDLGSWEKTAGIIKGLDLVITVNMAVAHLAGGVRKFGYYYHIYRIGDGLV